MMTSLNGFSFGAATNAIAPGIRSVETISFRRADANSPPVFSFGGSPKPVSSFHLTNSSAKLSKAIAFPSSSLFGDVVGTEANAGKDGLADVQLVCGEVTFNCHRVLLALKSHTFQRMFASSEGFTEGKGGPFIIEDISATVMEDILRFIYCGYINADMDAASPEQESEFIYAATKYDLKPLVDLLLLAIQAKLTATSACRYLLMADTFALTDLKMACFRAMTRSPLNRAVVVKSPEWKDVSAKADLFTEFMLFHGE